jgi:hypothetical protein
MEYQESNYEVLSQKSESSADILAHACESVLRKGAILSRKMLLGSRKLLTVGGWLRIAESAARTLRRLTTS